jgi:hypothetical protein
MIIGATGGSGTRAVARVVQQAGLWIGSQLNESMDAVEFGSYSDRWINAFLQATDHWKKPLPTEQRVAMVADLQPLLSRHLEGLLSSGGDGRWLAWGWKEPRSMYLLPFWDDLFPTLRFLHVVRDGRDMAFSSNQNQLLKHGDAMLGPVTAGQSQPLRSIALWSCANTMVARYGARHLGDRYMRIRFEDLCAKPVNTVAKILVFFGLPRSIAEQAAALITPPSTLGRWRVADAQLQRALHRLAAPALLSLGYPVPWRYRLAAFWRTITRR